MIAFSAAVTAAAGQAWRHAYASPRMESTLCEATTRNGKRNLAAAANLTSFFSSFRAASCRRPYRGSVRTRSGRAHTGPKTPPCRERQERVVATSLTS